MKPLRLDAARVLAAISLVCVGCVARAAEPPRTQPLTAVLSQVEGNVTLKAGSSESPTGSASPIRRLSSLQIVQSGDEVRVPAGGRAGLVCSTDRWLALTGPIDLRLTLAACENGRALPPGTYGRLAPRGGRLRIVGDTLVLERFTRGLESKGPVLLAPRNSTVLEERPRIEWLQPQKASRYRLQMQGDVELVLNLKPEDVSCAPTKEAGESVCSLPYPATAPALKPGSLVLLRLTAWQPGDEREQGEPSPPWCRRLSAERAATLAAAKEALGRLPIGESASRLLEANLYAEHHLYALAIPLYQELLTRRKVPEVLLALGDAYRATGLLAFAERPYREVLAGLGPTDDRALEAASHLGLGQVEFARQSFSAAASHFARALEIYSALRLDEEAAAAKAAAEKAQALIIRE